MRNYETPRSHMKDLFNVISVGVLRHCKLEALCKNHIDGTYFRMLFLRRPLVRRETSFRNLKTGGVGLPVAWSGGPSDKTYKFIELHDQ